MGLCLASLLAETFAMGQAAISVKTADSTVTITEPGRVSLDQLYRSSDVVAIVRVLSGDTESYDVALYKAEVVTAFKGTAEKNILFFGPYIGIPLGEEAVVFLRAAKAPAKPKNEQSSPYGTVKYFDVFEEGYSHMRASYECVFDGKTIDEECDKGVRVCTDYIVLPKGTPTFPPSIEEAGFGCRWVRRSKFESLLTSFGHQ
jgi:hypothetical protein